jgi:uncharacterized protein
MFGSYELEYEGRNYFGNVSLREFHIFDYSGNLYLADVCSMATYPISSRISDLIGRVASTCGGLVPESAILELRKFKIIADEEDEPPKATSTVLAEEGEARVEHPVVNISLFLAQACNMRCVYCYGGGGEYAEKGMMSEETAFKAVDWLIANSGNAEKVNICFFGGEPLLNFPVMKKSLSYARKKAAEKGKQITFWLTTNGSLLSDEIISFMKDQNITPMISFDGPPEYQDRQRPFRDGSGSYDRVCTNLRRLREVLPHITGRATVYGDADPFLIKGSMVKAGFSTCYVAKVSPVVLNKGLGTPADDGLREERLERMLAFNRQEIDELLAAIRERKIDKDWPPPLLARVADMHSGCRRYYRCGVGKGMVGISITGDIYPCHRFTGQKEMRMGNVAEYRVNGLNDYYRSGVDQLAECRSCWARYFCGGGCFYRNKAFTGDMHRPDALDCREEKALIEGLIHLWHRLDESDKGYLNNFLKEDISQDRRA